MQSVILTGMSGAGKSTALKALEDMGFFCMDNLPVPLIEKFMELAYQKESEYQRFAISIDIRSGSALGDLGNILERLKKKGQKPLILFLDASDDCLVMRFKETRRSHPLAKGERIACGIAAEREAIRFLRDQADIIIDTSNLLTKELRAQLERIFMKGTDYLNLYVTILSFGFKYGIPEDSDLAFDVRFLPNPYYDVRLRPKTGNDPEIRDYVMKGGTADEFLDKLEDLVRFLLPNYVEEGKNSLVISIGCTGGKHRSVVIANELYRRLQNSSSYGLKVEHRDIDKDRQRGK